MGSPSRTPFAFSNGKTSHLAYHPADAQLSPPESYLFIQDGLIIGCAAFWLVAYVFYAARTFKDKRSAMPLYCLAMNFAWESFYFFQIASTKLEWLGGFFGALLDLGYVAATLRYGHGAQAAKQTLFWTSALLLAFWLLSKKLPDHQMTGFWVGIYIQVFNSWGSIHDLLREKGLRGHSIEIWCMRTIGSTFGYLAYVWRFMNVPDNWAYSGTAWAQGVILISVIGDLVYPVVYWKIMKRKMKVM